MVFLNHGGNSPTEFVFQHLRLLERSPQPYRQVIGKIIAAQGQFPGMLDSTVAENRQVRGAASDVKQGHSQLHLITTQYCMGRGDRFQHNLCHIQAGPIATGDQVVERSHVCRHDMDIGYQPHPGHTQWILNTGVIINHVLLGQDMDNLLVI